jgi:hypothetical protein
MYQYHPKLAHLSDEEINELILGYSGKELIGSLIKRFNIDCYPSKLHGLLPPIIIEGEICPYCGVQIVRRRPVRGSKYCDEQIRCSTCNHSLNSHCKCSHCMEIIQKAEQSELVRVRTIIAEYCNIRNPGIVRSLDVEKLTLKAVVVLNCV